MAEPSQPDRHDLARKAEQAVRRIEGSAGDPANQGLTLVLHKRERSLWPLAAALVILGFTAAITAVIIFPMWAAKDLTEQAAAGAKDTVVQAAQALGSALRPEVVRREAVTIVTEQAQTQAKLVVYDHPVRVQVAKAEEYRLLWDYLYLGQNAVTLRIDGNRVQWVVDLQQFGEEDVTIDEATKIVHLRFPAPRLDADMVVVQTDPSQVQVETARGWARWPGSTDTLVAEAKRELKPRIVYGANTHANREAAARSAELVLGNLFQPMFARLAPEGYRVEIDVASD